MADYVRVGRTRVGLADWQKAPAEADFVPAHKEKEVVESSEPEVEPTDE